MDLKRVVVALAFVMPIAQAVAAEQIRGAAEAYAAGDYAYAAMQFRERASHSPSTGVFHNLGNAEWNAGRTGPAILAWERAQWLDPASTNAQANLRFGRFTAQIEAPRLKWFEVASTWLPVHAWPWIASASLWLAVSALVIPTVFRWRKRDWHQAFAAASFAVFLATLPALLGVHTRSKLGVVLADKTALRLTPTREAQSTVTLRAGESARVERERGNYVFVRINGDAAGWVERERLGVVAAR